VKQNPAVFLANLHLSATNDDLRDMMRNMKAARETGWDHVICTIDGFANDSRELWQIPEVRAYCRRLMTTGFVAYLDVFAGINPDPATHPLVRQGFGSGEVWLIGEGVDIGQPKFVLEAETVERLRVALFQANKASDAAIGQFGST
jgi:hypothetical protein